MKQLRWNVVFFVQKSTAGTTASVAASFIALFAEDAADMIGAAARTQDHDGVRRHLLDGGAGNHVHDRVRNHLLAGGVGNLVNDGVRRHLLDGVRH